MNPIIETFIREALQQNLSDLSSLEQFKRSFASRHHIGFLRNPDIKKMYDQMLLNKNIKSDKAFEDLLVTKKIRTLSGVAVVAVLTKPYPCPGKCVYCPDEQSMPKSYLSNEPAVMRAITAKFNPYRQVQSRLTALQVNGHATDKIELIIMGGTFSSFPKSYQRWFVKECFRAANDYPREIFNFQPARLSGGFSIFNSKEDLLEQQKINEKAKNRIVGLTLETRPDYIDTKEVVNFRQLGCTRVELGVQSIYDDVLKKNKRGHLVQRTIEATKLLKDAGFKINYHLMPGLLRSSFSRDVTMFQELFENPDFQPDLIKIYPCVVTKNSELYTLWKNKKYKPLTNEQTEKLICEIKKNIPSYVRITRLIRDIPEESIEAGPNISNLRQMVQAKGIRCNCIRCREVRGTFKTKDTLVLNRINYDASGGKEIYLEYVSTDHRRLYAMLRLRIPGKSSPVLPILSGAALIREIHTYGKLVQVEKKDAQAAQHIGLGKKLILEAERIAKKEFGLNKVAVISGIGVRGYYRKLGYRQKETYMVKRI